MNKEIANFEDELDKLKSTLPEERRSVFLNYCNEKIQLEGKKVISMQDASSRICGICSLFFEELMPEFEEVMDIACDLELPDNVRDRPIDDWGKLVQIVQSKK